jgi:hypothetical protein
MNRQTNKRLIASVATAVVLFALSVSAWAWYPSYPYVNPYYAYPGYYSPAYPYYRGDMGGTGFYGYAEPQWYMRGRMNRYGDFRFDLRLRNFSMADFYNAWLFFNSAGY